MQTNNDSHGQSGYSAQQMASNVACAHPGFNRQQGTHANVAHPATYYQTQSSHAVYVPHGTWQPTEGRTRGQPGGAGQQAVDFNGAPYTMGSHNNHSAGVPNTHDYALHAQRARLVQPCFAGQQMANTNDWSPTMVDPPRHNGTAVPSDFWKSISQQSEQFQNSHPYNNPHNRQTVQYSQNSQNYQNCQVVNPATNFGVYDNLSGGNIPDVDAAHFVYQSNPPAEHLDSARVHHTGIESPLAAVTLAGPAPIPNTGSAETAQPVASPEVSEDLQDRVNELVKERNTAYGGYIRNKGDYARYKQAVYRAKSKNSKLEDKSADYPTDEAKQVEIFQRIYDAFLNTGGNQDRASDSAENDNCLAYRTVQSLSGVEVELIAHDFVNNILSVQRGEPVLPPHFKVVQEETVMAKVAQVVKALKFNKLLCRSATMNAEFIARIAADPVGERSHKNNNQKNNLGKNTVLKAEAKKNGKSRKTKRAAEAEPEADTQDEAAAESNGVNTQAKPSQARPQKRARITKNSSEATQTRPQRQAQQQEQVQHIQLSAAAVPRNSHPQPQTINTALGSANPNGAAVDQIQYATHENHGHIQQTQQANIAFAVNPNDRFFGQLYQQSVEPNYDAFVQNQQQNIDCSFGLGQTESGVSNGCEQFLSSDTGLNHPLEPELGSDVSMDFTNQSHNQTAIVHQQQPEQQQVFLNQPVEQPIEQQQLVHHEQVGQEQPNEGHSTEQSSAGDDDLFADTDYEEALASLAPLSRFNAGNY